jgi:CBS domain containing-hemolysin-like protein
MNLFAEASTESSRWLWDVLGLLAIPALVVLNGLFVAAEFALVAVRKTKVEELQQHGVPGARSVLTALKQINRCIAATQLGITLASIGLGFVSEPALARLIDPLFSYLPAGWHGVATHSLATVLAFVVITLVDVIFGELIPKTMALQNPDGIALWMARPLLVFTRLTRPLAIIAESSSRAILRLFGYNRGGREAHVHSVEELLLLIEDTEEAGMLDPDQADYIENLFRLSNKRVRNCMVARDKMAMLEVNMPPDKVLEAVRTGAHTRMPVYEGDPNQIVGVVNTKDLFHLFSLKGVVILQDAMYPALFLKPDESMANALRLFRKSHRPMALVRDDDGNILGLITLEDVLEEIIGDIEDEHDRPTPRLVWRRPALPRPVEKKK